MTSAKSSLFFTQTQDTFSTAGDPTSCRINIAGYTLENFKNFNSDSYTIICETGKYFEGLTYYPHTKIIVLEGQSKNHLVFSDFPKKFIPELAEELKVAPMTAYEKSIEFFEDKQVVVQPNGIQGVVYNFMQNVQNYVPVAYTYKALAVIKTTGATGLRIITGAPLTFVGVTYLAGMTCAYFGSVAGNNTVGAVFNTSAYVLTRPMRGVEITVNGLVLLPLSNLTGMPMIMNGTGLITEGAVGIQVKDYAQMAFSFERITNSTSKKLNVLKKVWKAVKQAFIEGYDDF